MGEEKSRLVPTGETGEVPLAVLDPAELPGGITARWRRYEVVRAEGWGEPGVILWTLWCGPRRLRILDARSGKEIENLSLPDRFRGLKKPLETLRGVGRRWELTYDGYHAVPTGEESARSRNRLVFDLEKMSAEFEVLGFEIYD